ncbi:MAG TPA: molybdate ABC transporter substrate-binding protein [Egibacteraceae bacterium]
MRAILRTTTAAVLALALTACGTSGAEAPAASGGPAEAPSGGSAPTSEPSGEVVVFAAASLTDALEAIAADLEAATPGLDVVFSFAGSQQLAAQIAEGAPADVFASADETQMDVVADAGLVAGEPRTFARNSLAIAVEPGNPLGIRGLADLARADVTLVLADEDVPAGRYAAAALEAAGVTVAPASLEVDVRAVLSKVALGEADAGIVYRSDIVAAGGDVDEVAIPPDDNVVASYPIALVDGSPNPAGGALFLAAVASDAGREVLAEHGFTAP